MVWSQTPRLLNTLPWRGWSDPFGELNRIQSEMARLLAPVQRALAEREFPPVRVSTWMFSPISRIGVIRLRSTSVVSAFSGDR